MWIYWNTLEHTHVLECFGCFGGIWRVRSFSGAYGWSTGCSGEGALAACGSLLVIFFQRAFSANDRNCLEMYGNMLWRRHPLISFNIDRSGSICFADRYAATSGVSALHPREIKPAGTFWSSTSMSFKMGTCLAGTSRKLCCRIYFLLGVVGKRLQTWLRWRCHGGSMRSESCRAMIFDESSYGQKRGSADLSKKMHKRAILNNNSCKEKISLAKPCVFAWFLRCHDQKDPRDRLQVICIKYSNVTGCSGSSWECHFVVVICLPAAVWGRHTARGWCGTWSAEL